MSLVAWRHHFATRGLAIILALLTCGSAIDWAHPGGDDPDCDPQLVVHNHSAHRIGSQPAQSSPEGHCFICHSLRLLHSARPMRVARLVAPHHITSVAPVSYTPLLSGHDATISSRGPPPVLL